MMLTVMMARIARLKYAMPQINVSIHGRTIAAGIMFAKLGNMLPVMIVVHYLLDMSIDFAAGSWNGMMFNVEAIHDIVITHLYFRPW